MTSTPDAALASRTGTRPFAPYEWLVVRRYLGARRSIVVFSFLGIMLGVATLIVVMSVMNGFRKELLDKIIGINGHAFLEATADQPLTDYDAVVDRLEKVPGVTLALPMIASPAGVSSPYNQTGGQIWGVREADLKRLPGVAGNVKLGTLDGFDRSGGVAIGQQLAEQLGLRIGDNITLLTAKGAQTPFGIAPRIKAYPVVAIFRIGMSQFDASFVYMPLSEAQAFFNKDGQATVIEAFVTTPDDMDAVRQRIDAGVGRTMLLTDWRERNKTFFDALNVERNVMFIILMMIILVAALNVISGLIMLVKDKGHDIAILRTMGATRGAIMRIFLLTGATIGVVGSFAGFLVGLLMAENVENIRQFLNKLMSANIFPSELYFLSHLPSIVDPWDVTAVVVTAFALAVLATLYPSWRAASLDPVKALRYE
jgi:lipoprotein-releasing system permease protein